MTSLIQAAEEGGTFNPLEPQWGLAVWVTLAFIVVFYFLAKKLFPRLEEGLADRERRIKGDLEKAEGTRQEAERVLEDYKSRIAQAREESNRIIDEARQAAESLKADLTKRAEGEARLIVDKAQKELSGEKDRAMAELQAQLAAWSTEIASLIVQKELTPESQRQLVDAFIRDVQEKGV